MKDLVSRLSRALAFAARHPLWVLALLVALQTLPSLSARDLTPNDEVRHADALRGVLSGEHSLVLHMGGRAYSDKPPVWFWLVAGIVRATGLSVPSAFFLASALGAFAFAGVTWALARRLAGADPETSLGAALLALSTSTTALLAQTTRMDLAFSALIVGAEMALWRAWARPAPNRWPLLAAALATLAAGIKGPLALGLPVVASLAWLGWAGRLRRLLCRDVALATVGVVAVMAAYGALVVRAEGWGFLDQLLHKEVWRRAAAAGGHALPFWFYVAALPAALFPSSLLAFGLPWPRYFGAARQALVHRVPGALRARVARARAEAGPHVYLALVAISGVLLLSALSGKLFIYLAPVLPPLAVLLAQAVRRMGPSDSRRAFDAFGWGAIVLAVAVPFAPRFAPWSIEIPGLLPFALVLGAGGAAVLLLRRTSGLLAPAVGAVGFVLAMAVATRFVAGSLDPVMSPRATAEEVRAYVDRGYAPLVFRTYAGILAWHAGGPLPEADDPEALRRLVETPGPVVVTMPRKYWDRNREIVSSLRIVSERWIAGEARHVVAVRD